MIILVEYDISNRSSYTFECAAGKKKLQFDPPR